jgi:amino acid transporter
MAALASMAMWFCGLSCITSASRALFSLARDNGTPFAAVFRHVSPRHGTPVPAIWGIVAASLLAMLWAGGVPIITSLSTVALYAAYIAPVMLALRARWQGSDWPKAAAVWTLGRHGGCVNLVAVIYTLGISLVLMAPPNELAGKTFLGLVAALILVYFLSVRRRFSGPKWSASSRFARVGE